MRTCMYLLFCGYLIFPLTAIAVGFESGPAEIISSPRINLWTYCREDKLTRVLGARRSQRTIGERRRLVDSNKCQTLLDRYERSPEVTGLTGHAGPSAFPRQN